MGQYGTASCRRRSSVTLASQILLRARALPLTCSHLRMKGSVSAWTCPKCCRPALSPDWSSGILASWSSRGWTPTRAISQPNSKPAWSRAASGSVQLRWRWDGPECARPTAAGFGRTAGAAGGIGVASMVSLGLRLLLKQTGTSAQSCKGVATVLSPVHCRSAYGCERGKSNAKPVICVLVATFSWRGGAGLTGPRGAVAQMGSTSQARPAHGWSGGSIALPCHPKHAASTTLLLGGYTPMLRGGSWVPFPRCECAHTPLHTSYLAVGHCTVALCNWLHPRRFSFAVCAEVKTGRVLGRILGGA
jgi:hypothetical protein